MIINSFIDNCYSTQKSINASQDKLTNSKKTVIKSNLSILFNRKASEPLSIANSPQLPRVNLQDQNLQKTAQQEVLLFRRKMQLKNLVEPPSQDQVIKILREQQYFENMSKETQLGQSQKSTNTNVRMKSTKQLQKQRGQSDVKLSHDFSKNNLQSQKVFQNSQVFKCIKEFRNTNIQSMNQIGSFNNQQNTNAKNNTNTNTNNNHNDNDNNSNNRQTDSMNTELQTMKVTKTSFNDYKRKVQIINQRNKDQNESSKHFRVQKQQYVNTNSLRQIRSSVNNLTTKIEFDDFDIKQISMYEQIGKGNYASVRLGVEKETMQQYAVKVYQKEQLRKHGYQLRNLEKEVEILRCVDHPNILKLHYVCQDIDKVYLLTDKYDYKLIDILEDRPISTKQCKRYFKQLLKAMNYLHQQDIVHRDLKLENILIDNYNNIKLIDLGFSQFVKPGQKLNVYCGTPSYMSPQCINRDHYEPFKNDVWALGVILFVMTHRSFPFNGKDQNQLKNSINQCVFISQNPSLKIKDLLMSCFMVNENTRYSVKKIMQHEWMKTA